MKATLLMIAGGSLALASCSMFDPDYAEYKAQKEAEASAPSPYAGNPDPYGAPPAGNPYAAPLPAPGGEVGSYTPSTPQAYQPLPGSSPSPSTPTHVTPNTNLLSRKPRQRISVEP